MTTMETSVTFEPVSCANCGVDDAAPLATTRTWHRGGCYGLLCKTVVCRRCGLAYLNPRMSPEDYDRFYTEEYWQLNASSLTAVTQAQYELGNRICEFLASCIPDKLRPGMK